MTRAVALVPAGRGGPATLAGIASWAARRDVQVVSLAGDVLSALALVADGAVDVVLVHHAAVLAPLVQVTGPGRPPADGDPIRPEWDPSVDPRRQPRPAWTGATS